MIFVFYIIIRVAGHVLDDHLMYFALDLCVQHSRSWEATMRVFEHMRGIFPRTQPDGHVCTELLTAYIPPLGALTHDFALSLYLSKCIIFYFPFFFFLF